MMRSSVTGWSVSRRRLDAQYDKGEVAFAFAVEHLGTREIVPNAAGDRLRFTGKGEPFLFAAGNSDLLRQTAANITKRRNLDRTAVLQGLGCRRPGRRRRSARWADSAPSSSRS